MSQNRAGTVPARPPVRVPTAAGLLALVGLALLLRCLFLGRESLWLDESASWWFSSDWSRALHSEPTNPPVYYVLLHLWTRCFGSTEAGLRSFSVLPSICSVVLVFSLGKLLFNPAIAWVASAYQAISTFQIAYAQEARCFSLLTAVLLLSSVALWKAMDTSSTASRFRYFAGYALLAAAALYIHFIALFFLAAHGCFVLFRRRRDLAAYLAATFVTIFLFSPWIRVVLNGASGGGQVRRYLLLKLPQAYFSFMFGDTLVPLDEYGATHIRQTLQANAIVLVIAIAGALVLCRFTYLAARKWGDRLLYALITATVPVFLAFVVSFKWMLFDERYLIAASPFLYLVFAAAACELLLFRPKVAQRPLSVALVGAYGGLLLISLHQYYFNPRFGKEQWRDAVAYLDKAASPADFVLLDPDYLQYAYRYYRHRDLRYLPVTRHMAAEFASSPSSLWDRTGSCHDVWVVTAHYDAEPAAKLVQSVLPRETERSFPKGHGIEIASYSLPCP